MKTINSELVPWLIAKEGFNFADRDNVETVTEMLTKIILIRNSMVTLQRRLLNLLKGKESSKPSSADMS
jgi:hypothetical protein